MKYFKVTGIVLMLLILGFAVFIIYTPGEEIVIEPGPEFDYAGLVDIQNGQYDKVREYITLADGTRIAVTSLIPNNSDASQFPTILMYSPYTSSFIVPEMSWVDRIGSKLNTGKWGPDYENLSLEDINVFTSNGYALAFVDMRGTGSSTGYSGPFDPRFVDDAEEILEWIANQRWSDKKIGMMGQSYLGWSQFAAASTKSPYLKCIAPEVIFFNLYTEAVRPGGILAQRWLEEYSEQTMELMNRNLWSTQHDIPSFPSEPVIDEDSDGLLYDEIPVIAEGDFRSYSGNVKFADGNEREESLYLELTREHENNIWPQEVGNSIRFMDDQIDYFGNTWAISDSSVDMMIKDLKDTQIPVLIQGGFFDGFSKGSVQSFASLQETNPVSLYMTPRAHLGLSYEYWKWMGFNFRTTHQLLSTKLQFFDRYLKGLDNGYDTKPPVKILIGFDGWHFFDSWPPKETKSKIFSLGMDHSLSAAYGEEMVYKYDVDFSHSSSYNAKRFNPQLMHLMNDSLLTRNDHDKKCLVFETEVLNAPVTLVGSPIINLEVASDQENADIFVYLSDVDTSGTVHYVTEGKLRAGWHELFDNNEMVKGSYDVKPELPWHSFRKKNYDSIPFANDSIVNLKFDLKPQAWKFRPGHKIRISIAGADNNNYEFNPVLCPDNTLESCKPTMLKIFTGKKFRSHLELPVIN